ncbi:MAG: biotin transporter BioY [Bacillota bacterium]|nr:biotin transporter BioY [Bacillota bacterium]
MARISLFAALTAVGALIRLPLPPVPFTMQTLFVLLAGLLLGGKLGAASQLLYIAIGLAGVPVFAGGGGPQYVLTPGFGYLIGFAAAAYVAGRLAWRNPGTACPLRGLFVASLAGTATCYAIGAPYLWAVLRWIGGIPIPASQVLVRGLLVFVPWDLAKAGLAAWLAWEIDRRVRWAGAR